VDRCQKIWLSAGCSRSLDLPLLYIHPHPGHSFQQYYNGVPVPYYCLARRCDCYFSMGILIRASSLPDRLIVASIGMAHDAHQDRKSELFSRRVLGCAVATITCPACWKLINPPPWWNETQVAAHRIDQRAQNRPIADRACTAHAFRPGWEI
jgi:hypothetical protein